MTVASHESSTVSRLRVPSENEVQPAVAHGGVGQRAPGHQRGDDGGAHAGMLDAFLARLEHPPVGETESRAHAVGVVREERVHAERPGELLVVVRPADEGVDALERHLGRDLAGVVPSHAVGDQEEAEPRVVAEPVFVHFAHPAGMRHTLVGQHGRLDYRTTPALTDRSPDPVGILTIL